MTHLKAGTPFRRALMMAQALAAESVGTILAHVDLYVSLGKGGKQPHRASGAAAIKRAATKARNSRK